MKIILQIKKGKANFQADTETSFLSGMLWSQYASRAQDELLDIFTSQGISVPNPALFQGHLT